MWGWLSPSSASSLLKLLWTEWTCFAVGLFGPGDKRRAACWFQLLRLLPQPWDSVAEIESEPLRACKSCDRHSNLCCLRSNIRALVVFFFFCDDLKLIRFSQSFSAVSDPSILLRLHARARFLTYVWFSSLKCSLKTVPSVSEKLGPISLNADS